MAPGLSFEIATAPLPRSGVGASKADLRTRSPGAASTAPAMEPSTAHSSSLWTATILLRLGRCPKLSQRVEGLTY